MARGNGLSSIWDNIIQRIVGTTDYILAKLDLHLDTDKALRLTDGSTVRELTHSGLTKSIGLLIKDSDTDCATGDGKDFFTVPPEMNGMNLINVNASVYTPGTTNLMSIQIRRVRGATPADMLSGLLAFGSPNVYTSNNGLINTDYDDLVTGDKIFVDVDAIHTTPARGLSVTLSFAKVV